MKKYNLVLLCSVLLGALVLSSCKIDENENLLFQLKDNLEVGGKWHISGTTVGFTFETDGTFTYKDGSGNKRNGTYLYGQETSSSIFDEFEYVGEFRLRFKDGNGNENVKVKEEFNGDLYFKYGGRTYTQTS